MNNNAVLCFSSFEGGGPAFNVFIEDSSIAECFQTRKYFSPDHENLCGAGYDVLITFRGLKAGKTSVKIECRSPIAENYDAYYEIEVDENLETVLTEKSRTPII